MYLYRGVGRYSPPLLTRCSCLPACLPACPWLLQMMLLNERLVRSAYTGALSHPLIPDLEQLDRINSQVLHGFVARNYVAPRIVLSAAGALRQTEGGEGGERQEGRGGGGRAGGSGLDCTCPCCRGRL